MPEQPSPAEITALEALLASLIPVPSSLDRDRLMFRAGQATATRRSWPWPAATAALALVATTLGAALVSQLAAPAGSQQASGSREKVKIVEKIVYVVKERAPASPTQDGAPADPTSPDSASVDSPAPVAFSLSHFQLQNQLLRWGLDGLPHLPPPRAPNPPESVDRIFGLAGSSGGSQ
jgi:hypothetical protein